MSRQNLQLLVISLSALFLSINSLHINNNRGNGLLSSSDTSSGGSTANHPSSRTISNTNTHTNDGLLLPAISSADINPYRRLQPQQHQQLINDDDVDVDIDIDGIIDPRLNGNRRFGNGVRMENINNIHHNNYNNKEHRYYKKSLMMPSSTLLMDSIKTDAIGGNIGIGDNDLISRNLLKYNHFNKLNMSQPISRHFRYMMMHQMTNTGHMDDPDVAGSDMGMGVGMGMDAEQRNDDELILNHGHFDNNYHHGNLPILIGKTGKIAWMAGNGNGNGNNAIGTGHNLMLHNNNPYATFNYVNRKIPYDDVPQHIQRQPPQLQQSQMRVAIKPTASAYAMINGNRNQYEHDNNFHVRNNGINDDDDDDADTDTDGDKDDDQDRTKAAGNNDANYDQHDDGIMINDEEHGYRDHSPPKELQELFRQNDNPMKTGIRSNSRSSSSSNSGSSNGGDVSGGGGVGVGKGFDLRLQQKSSKKRQPQQPTKKQLKQNENKLKKKLQMAQLKQIKRSGGNGGNGGGPSSNLPPVTHSIASQLMLRTARGQRQYDVPQIECPSAMDGMERFACPTPDRQGRYRCIDDHVLCDGFIDCPEGEDEDRSSCMFYKTTKAHLDVLADALLRWARGR